MNRVIISVINLTLRERIPEEAESLSILQDQLRNFTAKFIVLGES
jgi:hypothetical protein